MKILFKSLESKNEFSNWLKEFKEISSSIWIEADLGTKEFIAKVYTDDKALVRFSKISFNDAGYDLVQLKDDEKNFIETLDSRVGIGLFMILPKFIDVINTFAKVDHSLEIDFSKIDDGYEAQHITFKSKTLKMKVQCSSISEFEVISDDVFFNVVSKKADPVDVTVSAEAVKSLTSISSIFTVDANRDYMEFYFTKDEDGTPLLNAKNPDASNAGRAGAYDFTIGKLEDETGKDLDSIHLDVMRSKFLIAVKNTSSDIIVTLSTDITQSNRVIFTNGNTITVIAIIKSI